MTHLLETAVACLSSVAGWWADSGPEIQLSWTHWLIVFGELAMQLALALYILARRKRRPSVTLAWILLVMMLPFVGAFTYLMLGGTRLGMLRKKRHAELVASLRERGWPHEELGQYPPLERDLKATASLAESVGGMPTRGSNTVELLSDSLEMIDALVTDIDGARHHCHLLTYILEPDVSGTAVAQALARAARRGVAARLLVDSVGSRAFLGSPLRRELEAAGVRVVEALPARLLRAALARLDLRNHRKLAVIDGSIGYTGSQNLVHPTFAPKAGFGPWVDATLRLRGPSVHDLQELFVEDWYLDTGEALTDLFDIEPPVIADGVALQIIPTGPDDEHEALRLIAQSAFHIAREELIVTTPYFVPGEAEVVALCTAARRGVRTALVVPAHNDSPLVALASRGLYQELLASGVEIHEYTEGLLHAKTMTVDRRLAMIGTANFDRRSFELNFEVSVLVYDSDFASNLRFLQRSYMADSTSVSAATWPQRPRRQRLLENAAGVLSPLL